MGGRITKESTLSVWGANVSGGRRLGLRVASPRTLTDANGQLTDARSASVSAFRRDPASSTPPMLSTPTFSTSRCSRPLRLLHLAPEFDTLDTLAGVLDEIPTPSTSSTTPRHPRYPRRSRSTYPGCLHLSTSISNRHSSPQGPSHPLAVLDDRACCRAYAP